MMAWTESPALPVPAAGGYAAALGDVVVYSGGATWEHGIKRFLDAVHFADTATGKWATGPRLPAAVAYGGCAVAGGALEVYGGACDSGAGYECWRLELREKRWRPIGALPRPAVLARAEAVGQEVFLFGGSLDLADLMLATDAVMARDAAGHWRQAGVMPQGRIASGASATAGGGVYLFGGCTMPAPGKVLNHNEAYRFDTRTHQWTRLRPLPKAARGLSATALDGRHILIAGGYIASQEEAKGKDAGYGFTNAVLIYDAETDRYRHAAPLPHAIAGPALVKAGGLVWAMGGEDRMRSRTASVWRARVSP